MTTYTLANPPLATSSPKVVAKPAFTAYTPVALAPASMADGSPSATFSFTTTGRNFLTAVVLVTGSPVFAPTAFVAISALSAAPVSTSSPAITAPAIEQIDLLLPVVLAPASPAFATAAFNQIQPLIASVLAPASPVIAAPTVGLPGSRALTAAPLATSPPAFGLSWFVNFKVPTPRTTAVPVAVGLVGVTQTVWRLGDVLAGLVSETLGRPPLGATAVAAGAPVFGSAVLLSIDNLAATGVATGLPSIGFPAPVLFGANLTPGSPVLGVPAFSSLYLFASGLAPTSPVLGSSGVNTTGIGLTAVPLTVGVGGAGFMGLMFIGSGVALGAGIGVPAPAIGQVLAAASLTPSAPVLAAAGPMVPLYHLTAALAFTTGSPVLSAPAPVQFASPLIVGAPVLSVPSLHVVSNLAATSISTQSPVLAAGFFNYLTAIPLAAGSPVIGSPAPGKILSAVGLPGAAPVIGTPQLIALVASSLTAGHPVLGVPTRVGEPGFPIGITTASPVLESPTLIQTIAVGLTTSAPVLAAPVLAAISHLTAASLTPAAGVVGAPLLESIDSLVGVSLQGGQAGVGQPALNQIQPLAAASIATSGPEIGRPTSNLSASLNAASLTPASPSITAATLMNQVQTLVAVGLIGSVQFSPAIMGGHQLLLPPPPGLVTGSPVLGVANLIQVYPPGTKFITLITPPRVIVVTYVYPWSVETAAA